MSYSSTNHNSKIFRTPSSVNATCSMMANKLISSGTATHTYDHSKSLKAMPLCFTNKTSLNNNMKAKNGSKSSLVLSSKYQLPRLPQLNADCDDLTAKINELIKKYDQLNINYMNSVNNNTNNNNNTNKINSSNSNSTTSNKNYNKKVNYSSKNVFQFKPINNSKFNHLLTNFIIIN